LAAPHELDSPAFAGATIAFWARRLARMACPHCDAVASLAVYVRPFGAGVYCMVDNCEYHKRHVNRA
jgi:hypothetical protein